MIGERLEIDGKTTFLSVTVDGEPTGIITLYEWGTAMLDIYENQDVARMFLDLMDGKTVRDGGGAQPVFEYARVERQ